MNNKQAEIGTRIREARRQNGLNQTQLADLLGKSLRTIQKYESGEIDISIATINEIAQKLETTPTYLIGYDRAGLHIDCFADVCDFLFQLESKAEIDFSIEVEKPKENGRWKCAVVFDGQNANASYNSALCLFLEEYQLYKEKLETYWISPEAYEGWKEKHLAYYASHALQDKPFEQLNETERLTRRNALIEQQLGGETQ